MKHAPGRPVAATVPAPRRQRPRMAHALAAATLALACGIAAADHDDGGLGAPQLRQFIGQQVGGIDKLKVQIGADAAAGASSHG